MDELYRLVRERIYATTTPVSTPISTKCSSVSAGPVDGRSLSFGITFVCEGFGDADDEGFVVGETDADGLDVGLVVGDTETDVEGCDDGDTLALGDTEGVAGFT